MKRSWPIWTAFLVCLAVVMAAMGWISMTAVSLDRAEAAARAQAALEENVRLALWRMDTTIAPLLAQENARPYFAYSTFLPVDRGYGEMFQRDLGGEVLLPSPLLGEASPHVLVYFQFEPNGSLTSPHVPVGGNDALAVPGYLSREAVQRASDHLNRLGTIVDRQKLMAMLPQSEPEPVEVVFSPVVPTQQERIAQRARRVQAQQKGKGAVEYVQRDEAINQMAQSNLAFNQRLDVMNQPQPGPSVFHPLGRTDLRGVAMTPLWIDGRLLLARRVSVGGPEYVQGCLLNWPEIKAWLLETVEDLLPGAELEPIAEAPSKETARMLAALPVALIPGAPTFESDASISPILLSLAIAWACVLMSAAAVAVLVWGVVRLSQRRAAFVSAVTHELRTPLTTFHMYTEMLAEGMVPDQAQRQAYLGTLRAEASRLTHMVENVLAYARLERGRGDGRVEDVSLGDLLGAVQGRLAERAVQAGMELVVEDQSPDSEIVVRANRSAVEQILLNLVDNACKYAASASDRRIHLTVQRADGAVEVQVRDHGPGISGNVSGRLFRPFSKSAKEAAHTAPGIGLGLALSRRLARDMGGRLKLDPKADAGACFVLTLPVP
jgi:signal transduction histidine kinase